MLGLRGRNLVVLHYRCYCEVLTVRNDINQLFVDKNYKQIVEESDNLLDVIEDNKKISGILFSKIFTACSYTQSIEQGNKIYKKIKNKLLEEKEDEAKTIYFRSIIKFFCMTNYNKAFEIYENLPDYVKGNESITNDIIQFSNQENITDKLYENLKSTKKLNVHVFEKIIKSKINFKSFKILEKIVFDEMITEYSLEPSNEIYKRLFKLVVDTEFDKNEYIIKFTERMINYIIKNKKTSGWDLELFNRLFLLLYRSKAGSQIALQFYSMLKNQNITPAEETFYVLFKNAEKSEEIQFLMKEIQHFEVPLSEKLCSGLILFFVRIKDLNSIKTTLLEANKLDLRLGNHIFAEIISNFKENKFDKGMEFVFNEIDNIPIEKWDCDLLISYLNYYLFKNLDEEKIFGIFQFIQNQENLRKKVTEKHLTMILKTLSISKNKIFSIELTNFMKKYNLITPLVAKSLLNLFFNLGEYSACFLFFEELQNQRDVYLFNLMFHIASSISPDAPEFELGREKLVYFVNKFIELEIKPNVYTFHTLASGRYFWFIFNYLESSSGPFKASLSPENLFFFQFFHLLSKNSRMDAEMLLANNSSKYKYPILWEFLINFYRNAKDRNSAAVIASDAKRLFPQHAFFTKFCAANIPNSSPTSEPRELQKQWKQRSYVVHKSTTVQFSDNDTTHPLIKKVRATLDSLKDLLPPDATENMYHSTKLAFGYSLLVSPLEEADKNFDRTVFTNVPLSDDCFNFFLHVSRLKQISVTVTVAHGKKYIFSSGFVDYL